MGYMRDVDGRRLDSIAVTPLSVYNPQGLRRFRARRSQALRGRVDIVVMSNSIGFGVGSSGANSIVQATNSTYATSDNYQGWVGQLRQLLNAPLGVDPGEGFILGDDPRITLAGGGIAYAFAGPIRQSISLPNASATATFTVPSNPVTAYVGIVFWDQTNNVLPTVTVNGGAVTPVTTPGGATAWTATGSSKFKVGYVPTPTAGQNVVITGNASGSYISGLDLVNNPNGYHVHRTSQPGYITADFLGGATNGVVNGAAGTNGQQDRVTRAAYQWCANPGLMIVAHMDVNDYTYQTTPRTVTATTTSGSPTLTITSGTGYATDGGRTVTGTGIPGGATVSTVSNDGLTVTMSANATASGSVAVTIGGASSQNGMTPTTHASNIAQQLNNAAGTTGSGALANGWTGLIIAGPRSPVDVLTAPQPTYRQTDYIAAAKGVVQPADANFGHVAFLDISKVWGSFTEASSTLAGLQPYAGSVHPSLLGHGDIAYLVRELVVDSLVIGATTTAPPA